MKLYKILLLRSVVGLLFLSLLVPTAYCGGISYYIYERPGKSVMSLIDESGSTINRYRYTDFGGTEVKTEGVPNHYQYSGEQSEPELDFIYLRKRYYDPVLGRFISHDPILGFQNNPQSLNPYIYIASIIL
jgi:RHS repeat-associated protein